MEDESRLELSLVIPALNEAANLVRLLPELLALAPRPQVIVSDGGSTDRTVEVARELGVTVLCGSRGRGPQLNQGAEHCKGEYILFLHADSSLPKESYQMLLQTLRDEPDLDGGALRFSLAGTRGVWPRVYEVAVWLRNRILNLPYGDQGFFLRRGHWGEQTRFADWPLMEDVEWWERLGRGYTMRVLPWPLVTSARRFEQRGYLKSALRNLSTMIRYKRGASPFTMAKEYHR